MASWGQDTVFSIVTFSTVLVVLQVLFRSVNKLLMDTATAEYLFCCDFFQEDTIFNELFAATLAVVESALAASLQVCPLILCVVNINTLFNNVASYKVDVAANRSLWGAGDV